MTQVAKGNQVLSLLLTIVTNLLGVLTVPYLLHAFLEGGDVVKIKPGNLAFKLVLTVLVPTIIGMTLRASSKHIRAFVIKHKTALSLFSTTNLIMIVWQTLSGARHILLRQSPGHILLVTLIAIAMHVFYLILNWLVVKILPNIGIREKISVVIMVSQKSSPVAITVISYITDNLAQQGLFAIPCLIGQISQIFIGSLLARRLASMVDASEKLPSTTEQQLEISQIEKKEEGLEAVVASESELAVPSVK